MNSPMPTHVAVVRTPWGYQVAPKEVEIWTDRENEIIWHNLTDQDLELDLPGELRHLLLNTPPKVFNPLQQATAVYGPGEAPPEKEYAYFITAGALRARGGSDPRIRIRP